MNWRDDWKSLLWGVIIFAGIYFLPIDKTVWQGAIISAFDLAKWYAREHVILCLLPAFFIAGAIAVFISKESVIKLLGAGARKIVALSVASVSGTILAVCSCTVLPLFAGIYSRGAGIGAATAFLYSGPAINVLAIILTARILGIELGIARALGAILFSFIIGFIMDRIYRKEEQDRINQDMTSGLPEEGRPLLKDILFFGIMIGILIFVNWGKPAADVGLWAAIYNSKWMITGILGILLGIILAVWMNLSWIYISVVAIASLIIQVTFNNHILTFLICIIGLSVILSLRKDEPAEWMAETYRFTRQILPLLAGGVLVAGFFLGNPVNGNSSGIIPDMWIARLVGGNSIFANLFASVVGAFMYFATLTEVPILQGLLASGMGKGPALALLLAGPALSLPNMLVIRSVLGTRKTLVFISLVILMATLTGLIYGALF